MVVQKFVLPLQPISGMNEIKCSYKYAVIAQLVEHNLAKVGVASSSLVHRSKKQSRTVVLLIFSKRQRSRFARMAELVDALVSGASV